MEENESEKNLDNNSETQSERLTDEIIANETTDIIKPNRNENMKGNQHPDLNRSHKKWKEYFFDFLMIFLAVSLGYIAENFREHLLDKELELKYVQNLIRDLKEEKKGTILTIEKNNKMIIAIDTFISIRALDFSVKENNSLFFKLFVGTELWVTQIQHPNEITLNQIKATSGLNVIRPNIAELIAGWDISNQDIKLKENELNSHHEETVRSIFELVDLPSVWDRNELKKNLPPLMIDDKKKLMKYFNLNADLMWTLEDYVTKLKRRLILIDNLVKNLETEYGIK